MVHSVPFPTLNNAKINYTVRQAVVEMLLLLLLAVTPGVAGSTGTFFH